MIKYDKNNDIQPDVNDIYRKIGELQLPVYIFKPQVENKYNNYAVICIHGGGWRNGIKPDSDWNGGPMVHQAKIFSQLGFYGVSISYRCLTNPGTDIMDLIDDCKQAVLYVKDKLNIDNNHILLIGDSAGGQLATYLGISDEDDIRPGYVISCNPALDCTGKYSFVSHDEITRRWVSPIYRDVKKSAKFLFIHGDKDPTTPIENTYKMNKQLKQKGFDTEMITLKDVMHAFILYDYRSTDEEIEKYMEMIEKYLEKKLF